MSRSRSALRPLRRLAPSILASIFVAAYPAGAPADANRAAFQIAAFDGFPQQRSFVTIGAVTYFEAGDPSGGTALWKSDGTAAGTQLVTDLVPGSDSSGPYQLTASGGSVFFVATTPHGGAYLFKSDGTAEGTLSLGPSAGELTNVNGTLFFTTSRLDEEPFVYRLLKDDAAGTVLVKEIAPEFQPPGWYYGPFSLTDVNGTLFFTAQYSSFERALWKSDGTPEGTQRFSDPFVSSSGPDLLTNVDGTLFFTTEDSSNGWELWTSDGTEAGTHLVEDIQSGTPGSDPSSLADVGGKLLFTACDDIAGCEPWVTQPGYPGAVRVADIAPDTASSNPTDFTRVGNLALFRVRPSVYDTNYWELWAIPISAFSLECSDGIDDDGDGLIDFDGGAAANGGVALGLPDPGCYDGSLISVEAPACQNGLDDDGDGTIDFDGGVSASLGAPLAALDPECTRAWRNTERPALCGLGAELALAMPLLALLRPAPRRCLSCSPRCE